MLLHLALRSVAAYDRLACLQYRKGDLERAVSLLHGWRNLAPDDHWPLIRQAIIEQQRGNIERRAEIIKQALGLTQGPLRASVAYLGAKLALRQSVKEAPKEGTPADPAPYKNVLPLLQECLRGPQPRRGAVVHRRDPLGAW